MFAKPETGRRRDRQCGAAGRVPRPNNSRQTTAAALTAILAADYRSEESRARDRLPAHPKENAAVLRPASRDECAGSVGRNRAGITEVIAPLVRDKGKYDAAVIAGRPREQVPHPAPGAVPPESSPSARICTIASRWSASPTDGGDAVPPASVDMVVTFRNIHNWMGRDNGCAGIRHHVPRPESPGAYWAWSSTAAIPPWRRTRRRRAGTSTRTMRSS